MWACTVCQAVFANQKTLEMHTQAVHKKPKQKIMQQEHTQAADSAPQHSETIDIAPLLQILSNQQKDILLLHAIRNDNKLVDKLIEAARTTVSEQDLEDKLDAIETTDPELFFPSMQAFVEADAPHNAINLLRCATRRVTDSLQGLASKIAGKKCARNEEDEKMEDEYVSELESFTPAGTLGAYWGNIVNILSEADIYRLLDREEDLGLLRELGKSALGVREEYPALLIGPGGSGLTAINKAQEIVEKAMDDASSALERVRKKVRR